MSKTDNLSTDTGLSLRTGITFECWCDEDGYHEQFNKPMRKLKDDGKNQAVKITSIDHKNKVVTFEEAL